MATTQPRKTAARKTAAKSAAKDRRWTIGVIDAVRDAESDLDHIESKSVLVEGCKVSKKLREALKLISSASLALSEAEEELWSSIGE